MIDAAHRRARKYPPIRATYNACNMIANGVQIADYERLFGLGYQRRAECRTSKSERLWSA
jgi:hypothetical protein